MAIRVRQGKGRKDRETLLSPRLLAELRAIPERRKRLTERLITLDVRARARWRQWLAGHHVSSPGIWLVRHKPHTGVRAMPHEDLVSEALCVGWVDSLIKRFDGNRSAVKDTPRKPTSTWSDSMFPGRCANSWS
jgi:hypothetical protein